MPGKKRNRSYSLDGKVLWEFDGRMSNLVIPSPFAAHGLCYIASGYVGDAHRPTFAVRPGANGDLVPGGDFEKSPFIAWYQGQSSAYNPSQLVYGDYLYTLYDRGFLTCHDAKTGNEVYGKQRFSPSGSFTASPWAYNGRLFFLSEDGLTYVVKAGPAFEILERNALDELCLASPAVVRDKLLIRTASKLYCLTEGARLDSAAQARLKSVRKTSATVDVWSAAAEGNRDTVARLLAAGTSVDARQPSSRSTPLNTAAVFGETDVAKLLLAKGADVSLANKDGNTALHIAAFFANAELVQLLLDKGASVSAKNDQPRVDIYDPVTDTWSRGPDLPAGHSHAEGSTFVHGDRIFIAGGMARRGDERWIDNKVLVLLPSGRWPCSRSRPDPCLHPWPPSYTISCLSAAGPPTAPRPNR